MYSVENLENERHIWTRFLKGDNQVLSLIYLHHSNALYDYGCRFTVDKDLVKDCIQDIFCTLIKSRRNLSETDNIRLYLLKSLKRKLIRELKNIGNQPKSLSDQDYSFNLRWAENLDEQLREIDDVKRNLITEAMQSLTDRQKEAIYLRFNRGLEYEEISFLLNLNYQSSRALIHRAVEKLREVIHVPDKKINQILFAMLCSEKKGVFQHKK